MQPTARPVQTAPKTWRLGFDFGQRLGLCGIKCRDPRPWYSLYWGADRSARALLPACPLTRMRLGQEEYDAAVPSQESFMSNLKRWVRREGAEK
eukprot:537220-Rhodomonas_salina.1